MIPADSHVGIKVTLLLFGLAVLSAGDCPGNANPNSVIAGSSLPDRFDLSLGVSGAIGFTKVDCNQDVAPVQVDQGTAAASASVAGGGPRISMELDAPRGTNSRAGVGACGLNARMLITGGSAGSTSAQGTLRCDIDVASVQSDGTANSYTIMMLLSILRIDPTTASPVTEIGSVTQEYCRLDTFCDSPLPDDGGGVGGDTISIEIPDLTVAAGSEYLITFVTLGSINANEGLPDFGGQISLSLDVSNLSFDFD
ncbi:MAG: hypothetical protein KDA33_09400 [Phycisphaerales bacterium]|nr:hypothetical protein [Phycisphaerales bacterium]